ncbi:MAG: antibiotic biosynthesis monooxygenase, partial [Butyrivibrio sp.]|uniref:putative quinol monooxygenase n=1 Tax=Butyrivibrio sp. TaxID=28121 RepID=UPI0025E6C25E
MVTIIATFNVKEDCVSKFETLAKECIVASRKEAGNVDYHLYTGKEDKTKFFFVEVWKDDEAINTHNA